MGAESESQRRRPVMMVVYLRRIYTIYTSSNATIVTNAVHACLCVHRMNDVFGHPVEHCIIIVSNETGSRLWRARMLFWTACIHRSNDSLSRRACSSSVLDTALRKCIEQRSHGNTDPIDTRKFCMSIRFCVDASVMGYVMAIAIRKRQPDLPHTFKCVIGSVCSTNDSKLVIGTR